MPRRLAVARHAGGFDAVGWTLLGFLLGASLAVFALLHADMHGLMRAPAAAPVSAGPPPAPSAEVVTTYAPPAPAALAAPPPVFLQPATPATPAPPTAPLPVKPAPVVNALASAGAASARGDGRRPPPPTASADPPRIAASSASPASPEFEDDAAAAGMTSRAGRAPPHVQAATPVPSDLY